MLAKPPKAPEAALGLKSRPGKGTVVTVVFQLSHVDRQPLGDVAGTLVTLDYGNPEMHFVYRHRCNGRTYVLDTEEIRKEIEDVPIQHIEF
jgi:hypothetical protein